MPSQCARIGGLTAGVVLWAWVCHAQDASVPAALAEYKNALPALQAKYAVVRMKGSWVQKLNSEQNPNSFKFKFEVSRIRDRFKALFLDRESETLEGIQKIGTLGFLFTPIERMTLRKKPGDEVFAVQRQEKPDDTSLEDYLRQNYSFTTPYFDFPFSGRSSGPGQALSPAHLMEDARFKCVEVKDVVVDGKPRRRFHFVFERPANAPPIKKNAISVLSAITLLVAPGEHDALYGYTATSRRINSEHPLIHTTWVESEATEDGFPIPKAVKHLRIQTGSEGDKIKLPDGQEVVGRILFQEVETIDSFRFKADPDEAFTLKAF